MNVVDESKLCRREQGNISATNIVPGYQVYN